MAKKQIVAKMQKRARQLSARGAFGPVSTINTAPVSVGNSVRGSAPRVTQTTDGARVVGRDFAFALSGTAGTVTGFEIIGCMPITPAVLPSSILRNYCQMFNKFCFCSVKMIKRVNAVKKFDAVGSLENNFGMKKWGWNKQFLKQFFLYDFLFSFFQYINHIG